MRSLTAEELGEVSGAGHGCYAPPPSASCKPKRPDKPVCHKPEEKEKPRDHDHKKWCFKKEPPKCKVA